MDKLQKYGIALIVLAGMLLLLFLFILQNQNLQKIIQNLFQPTSEPYFGLAMAMPPAEDAVKLGVEWYYVWSPTSSYKLKAKFVPMLWDGLPSDQLSTDYSGWILVLNEPNVSIQANLSPKEASLRLANLRKHYPKAKLLCCGQSVWAGDWTNEFLEASSVRPDAWHVHAYTESWITPAKAQEMLTQIHDRTEGDYWITEYGSPEGRLEDFQAMTEWFFIQPWIKRIAPYTNHQEQGAWWAIGQGVELMDQNGGFTEIGAYYHNTIQQAGR